MARQEDELTLFIIFRHCEMQQHFGYCNDDWRRAFSIISFMETSWVAWIPPWVVALILNRSTLPGSISPFYLLLLLLSVYIYFTAAQLFYPLNSAVLCSSLQLARKQQMTLTPVDDVRRNPVDSTVLSTNEKKKDQWNGVDRKKKDEHFGSCLCWLAYTCARFPYGHVDSNRRGIK